MPHKQEKKEEEGEARYKMDEGNEISGLSQRKKKGRETRGSGELGGYLFYVALHPPTQPRSQTLSETILCPQLGWSSS